MSVEKAKASSISRMIIIIRGPAGVGKSTISRIVQEKLGTNWAIIDVDKLKIIPLTKDQSNRLERSEVAHDVSLHFAKQIYDRGYNVILEEMYKQRFNDELLVFLRDNHMPYLKVFLTASVEQVVDRSNKREKNVSEDDIRRHYSEVEPNDDDLVIDTEKCSSEEAAEIIIRAFLSKK